MRSLSFLMRRAIHAQESGEVLLTLIKVTHAQWDTSLRLVANDEAVQHDGQTYEPCWFELTLPDDEEAALPVCQWSIDNIDREAAIRFRSATVGAILMQVRWVLAEQPDEIEIEFAGLEVREADLDAGTISGVATIEPILDDPVSQKTMSPQNAPGLF